MSTKCIQDLKDDTSLHFSDRWRWITQSRLVGFIFVALLSTLTCSGITLTVWHDRAMDATANVPRPLPNLFIHLEGVEGLDPCATQPAPPAFHLAIDADWIPARYRYCSGGGNSILRVCYHGMILAWGRVPWFCVVGSPADDGVDGVVTPSRWRPKRRAPCCERRCAAWCKPSCTSWGRLSVTWRERWRDWDIFAARPSCSKVMLRRSPAYA